MGSTPLTTAPELDWLPDDNRRLVEVARLLDHGDELRALQLLLAVATSSPWLRRFCSQMARRALRARLEREQPPAPLRCPDGPSEGPESLLAQVLAHPARELLLTTAEEPALRRAALYQLVWDARVQLELSLEEHASCHPEALLTLDGQLVREEAGHASPLNSRDRPAPGLELERGIRLALARKWLLAWHPWPWLPALAEESEAFPADEQLPRHWLEARAQSRRLLVEEQQRIDWEQLGHLQRDPELISIVIPVWGAGEELAGCLIRLREEHPVQPIEILLVDNGNTDRKTCEVLATARQLDGRVRVLQQPRNFGFALGCNLGFAASRGARILFLNSDALVGPGWLSPLLDALDDPLCRAVQPALLTPQHRIQCLGIVFAGASALGIPLYAGEAIREPLLHPRTVPAVTAACVLLRAKEFTAVHGFDVGYLNGQEDTDLCHRLTEQFGGYCRVATDSRVIHPEGSSPGRYRFIDANRSRLIHRWPHPNAQSLEAAARIDGLKLVGFRQLDRPDRPQWLHAPQPILRPPGSEPAVAAGP